MCCTPNFEFPTYRIISTTKKGMLKKKKKKKEKLDFKKTPCWEKESKQFSIQEWQKCNLAVVPSIMRKWKCVVDTYIYICIQGVPFEIVS